MNEMRGVRGSDPEIGNAAEGKAAPFCTPPVLYRTRRLFDWYRDLDLNNNAAARPRVGWPPSPVLLQPFFNEFIKKHLGLACIRTMTSVCLLIG